MRLSGTIPKVNDKLNIAHNGTHNMNYSFHWYCINFIKTSTFAIFKTKNNVNNLFCVHGLKKALRSFLFMLLIGLPDALHVEASFGPISIKKNWLNLKALYIPSLPFTVSLLHFNELGRVVFFVLAPKILFINFHIYFYVTCCRCKLIFLPS